MTLTASGNASKKHFPVLDWLRALAAISVFAHHFFQQFSSGTEDTWFGRLMLHLGPWGVAVFFVLSGFCIHWARIGDARSAASFNLAEYGARRFFRIYPAFFACTIICFIVGQFYTSNLMQQARWESVLAHLTLTSSFFVDHRVAVNSVLWSVVVECHFYILYGVLWHQFRHVNGVARMTAVAVAVCALTFAASVLLLPKGPGRVMLQSLFLASWWSWCLGAIVAQMLHSRKPALRQGGLGRVACVAFFALSLLMAFLPPPFDLFARRFALPLVAAAFLYFLLQEKWDFGRATWVVRLGLLSYSLYLFHPLAILVGVQFHLGPLASALLIFPLGIVLAHLSYEWIELPFIGLGRKFLGRKLPGRAAAAGV
ncbi:MULTISPECIES: acyltransferase family protein [unclassified Janthinobacterium]|uniref:acyltransferase family protein n=1 Tax=unclassified Janthinobacterium TaxID=2610881 RepID=UPI000349F889|nr:MULTISPECIES: acyltransferase [unclassified Janthinobacterium]MEC5163364.1 peptidoglycan/LPS O-acetylase OafA/YrhL [Janthinobacterium sp. CG_S6]